MDQKSNTLNLLLTCYEQLSLTTGMAGKICFWMCASAFLEQLLHAPICTRVFSDCDIVTCQH